MARIDKRRAGARSNARPVARANRNTTSSSSSSMGGAIEDTMFFPRLRRHAKWMFVLLAAVFGLGFVLFGIGAGGNGLGDLFRNNQGGSGGPSEKKALEATQTRPRDPQAWLALADVYRTNGDTDEAVAAQLRYTELAPRNAEGLRTLASDYFVQARARATQAQDAQINEAYSGRVSPAGSGPTLDGTPLFNSPLASLSSSTASSTYTSALEAYQTALGNAISAYKKVAALSPNDPNVQSELASNALQAGDTAVAIQAFRRYLKLAPDSSDAPLIRRQLNQLLAQSPGSAATAGSS
jgi:tetratricopeptide (TPR) repeat protein